MNVIQEITLQTSSGTTETAGSIGTLAEMAVELRTSVEGFKLPEDDSAFDQLSSDQPAIYEDGVSEMVASEDEQVHQEHDVDFLEEELSQEEIVETNISEVENFSGLEGFDTDAEADSDFEVEEDIEYEGDSDEFDDELDGFLDDELELDDEDSKRE
jgi:twitching motility protein PilJ